MAPMIRVDDEVYEHLNQRGRTEDSFNDVIRRELGLPAKRQALPQVSRSPNHLGPRAVAEALAPALTAALDRHLPPHCRRPQSVALRFWRWPRCFLRRISHGRQRSASWMRQGGWPKNIMWRSKQCRQSAVENSTGLALAR